MNDIREGSISWVVVAGACGLLGIVLGAGAMAYVGCVVAKSLGWL